MPRANRHHIPGCVWHITHRCHHKKFLLKFARDRRRWIRWLFEAKKRYDLSILNYMVTCNHIHLLVIDGENPLTIPRSMQLVAGRTAQEYNQRKQRKGAFWEDRYHATAVQTGEHLLRCMAYIDLNMVRAGVVTHPAEWECCGYMVIQNPPERYRVIDRIRLAELFGFDCSEELAAQQRTWVDSDSEGAHKRRESKWTESIAVGDQTFVEDVMKRLGIKARYRKISKEDGVCALREPHIPYRSHFDPEKGPLSLLNSYKWNLGS